MKEKTARNTILFAILIFSFSALTSIVKANNTILYPTKDSYVNSYEPDKNFGSQPNLECGTFYIPMTGKQQTEAYICFDLSEITTENKKIELYLDFSLVSEMVDFDIITIDHEWEESLITWYNKPLPGEKLLSFSVANDSEIHFDVSSIVSKDFFSICIDSPYFQNELVNITSREYDWENFRPRLIISSMSGEINLLSVIGALIFTIFFGSLIIWVKKFQNKLFKIIICTKCGYQNGEQGSYCYRCGTKLF
jgi:ribosomal protein L40E